MKTNHLPFPEITIHYKDKNIEKRPCITKSTEAIDILRPYYKECMQHHEEFWVLYLNTRNQVLGISCVAKGGIDKMLIDNRIVLQIALKTNATGIIVSHNHPTGNNHPSTQDDTITGKLKDACHLLDIRLYDHLIITEDSYYSYTDEGVL